MTKHNSEIVIILASVISSLVVVIRTLSYEIDLKGTAILNQVLCKLPLTMKESWSFYTIRRNWDCPNFLDSNEWLKEMAETHERMKNFPGKSKTEELVKAKTTIQIFAFIAMLNKFDYPHCPQCAD